MGLVKKGSTAVVPEETKKPESGTDAAIARLQAPKPEVTKASTPVYKQRDFDAEARGKSRCVMFAAALGSPALAGLPFKSLEDFLAIVEKAAEAGVNYSFKG